VARLREFDTDDAVRKAMRTFWRRGYQATSIKDLEEATGLTAGSIYKAYGSKKELFSQCMSLYMKEESYLSILLRMYDASIQAALRRLLDVIIESTDETSERPSGCLATNLVPELFGIDLELAQSASAGLAEMQKALLFRIKWAQENGDISGDKDSAALSAYFMVVIQGMLILSTSTRDVKALERARDIALAALD
jgi:TetR/AcrR family transcriptional repressor of nem operon